MFVQKYQKTYTVNYDKNGLTFPHHVPCILRVWIVFNPFLIRNPIISVPNHLYIPLVSLTSNAHTYKSWLYFIKYQEQNKTISQSFYKASSILLDDLDRSKYSTSRILSKIFYLFSKMWSANELFSKNHLFKLYFRNIKPVV